ncbi:MAG: gamma-glutamyl-gamma-aminobutyrate hydrolase family protein [Lachnospiraceae bacterium]|nr:gamma-glutamyl-gamma-aminobutyrate hydrolase family protein [Lachnospiraceae bacterium]
MNTHRPLIALTPYHNTEKDELYMRPAYLKAIRAAGGTPIILPLETEETELSHFAEAFDCFLFTGGPDIHPFFFGEETQRHCGNVSLKRDHMELKLLKAVMSAKKPILGICRGIQLLNIGLGGNIYQDLPSQFPEDFPIAHSQPFDYSIPSHTITITPGSLLAKIAESKTIRVNSMHHQAIREVAPGLAPVGYAPHGLIECIEMPDYPTFFLGVQWHPEYLWEQDDAAKRLFGEFVNAGGLTK